MNRLSFLTITLVLVSCVKKNLQDAEVVDLKNDLGGQTSLHQIYDFLKTNANSRQAFNPRNRAEDIEWHNAITRNEIRGFGKFILQHEDGPRVEEAKLLIKLIEYDRALNNEVHAKREFTQKYPEDSLSQLLLNDHFEELAEEPSTAAIKDHLESFPESPHKHKLEDFSVAIEAQHMIKGLKKNLSNHEHKSMIVLSKKVKLDGEFIEFNVTQNDFCYCTMKYRLEESPNRKLFTKNIDTHNYSLHVLELDLSKITGASAKGIGLELTSKYKNGFKLFQYEKGDDGNLLEEKFHQLIELPMNQDEQIKSRVIKDLIKLAKICRGT